MSMKDKAYETASNISYLPTATVECLDLAGWEPEKVITGKYRRQPEDNLADYLETTYDIDAPEEVKHGRAF